MLTEPHANVRQRILLFYWLNIMCVYILCVCVCSLELCLLLSPVSGATWPSILQLYTRPGVCVCGGGGGGGGGGVSTRFQCLLDRLYLGAFKESGVGDVLLPLCFPGNIQQEANAAVMKGCKPKNIHGLNFPGLTDMKERQIVDWYDLAEDRRE